MLSAQYRFDLRAHPHFFSQASIKTVDGVRFFVAKQPKQAKESTSQGSIVIPSFLKLSSVKRNAVKRVIRQALQRVLPQYKNLVVVVVARRDFLDSSPETLAATLEKLCQNVDHTTLPSIE